MTGMKDSHFEIDQRTNNYHMHHHMHLILMVPAIYIYLYKIKIKLYAIEILPLINNNCNLQTTLPFLGDKQVALIGGHPGCPYWGTNSLPFLGDKQVALFGGQTGGPFNVRHMY